MSGASTKNQPHSIQKFLNSLVRQLSEVTWPSSKSLRKGKLRIRSNIKGERTQSLKPPFMEAKNGVYSNMTVFLISDPTAKE